MGNIFWVFIAYLIVINIIGLAIMGIDKSRAKRHAWRIPEKTLFLVSIIGGSIGTLAGMYVFRHKTRHWYFVIGMPAILLLHIALCVWGGTRIGPVLLDICCRFSNYWFSTGKPGFLERYPDVF